MAKVGIIGVGNISPAYINGCRAFDILELVACADLDLDRARKVAQEYQIPRALTVEQLLADPEIDLVINLTIPAAHAEVSLRAIAAGKHVYSEKPLAAVLDDGRRILEAAKARGVLVGCAPDTFLFGQHQTARKLVDDGAIGRPVAAAAFYASRGPEPWHPNPDFFYAPGGGPMLDMGPYAITCLVNLLGPAVRVAGVVQTSFPQRVAKDGHTIPVHTPTHYSGTIEFASGALATVVMSFDVTAHHLPGVELYGECGTLVIPDPNGYDPREVRLFVPDKHDWDVMPLAYPAAWARGVGVADMAYAIRDARPIRASGELAYHVLEILHAFGESSRSGQHVTLQSVCDRPAALSVGLSDRRLE
jgi:predicted dehydrogenase